MEVDDDAGSSIIFIYPRSIAKISRRFVKFLVSATSAVVPAKRGRHSKVHLVKITLFSQLTNITLCRDSLTSIRGKLRQRLNLLPLLPTFLLVFPRNTTQQLRRHFKSTVRTFRPLRLFVSVSDHGHFSVFLFILVI